MMRNILIHMVATKVLVYLVAQCLFDTYTYSHRSGPEACGTVKPAYIMSTSYSYDEADLTPAYMERQCAEYAKVRNLSLSDQAAYS